MDSTAVVVAGMLWIMHDLASTLSVAEEPRHRMLLWSTIQLLAAFTAVLIIFT